MVKQTNPVTPQQIVAFLLLVLRRCEWIGTIDYWRLQVKNRLPSQSCVVSTRPTADQSPCVLPKSQSSASAGMVPSRITLPYVHATTYYHPPFLCSISPLGDAAKDRAIQHRTGPCHTANNHTPTSIIINQGIPLLILVLPFIGGARADCRQARKSNLGIVAFHPEAPRSTINFAPGRISLLECHTE